MFCLACALFLCKLDFLAKDLHTHGLAYARRLNSCIRRPVLACMMPLPRNPNFCLFVSTFTCVFYVALFLNVSSPITICLPINMFVCCHMCRCMIRVL